MFVTLKISTNDTRFRSYWEYPRPINQRIRKCGKTRLCRMRGGHGMRRNALVTTLVIIGLFLSNVIVPLPTRAAPPPPPTSSTPTPPPPPKDPVVDNQSTHTPPSPDKLSPEVEKVRAQQAIESTLKKYLNYWGPRYQVAPVEVSVDGDWASGLAKWKSEARTLKAPINILAHRLPDGSWQALMPDTDGLYLQWLDAVPERLVPTAAKGQLDCRL